MDGERLTMRLSSQMPTAVRAGLAAALPGRTEQNVRVLVGDVGGGFGLKTDYYPEDLVVGWAALATGRPVKWQAQRLEEFTSATHGRDAVSRAEMALDAAGKVLAMRVRTWVNVGASPGTVAVAVPLVVGPYVLTSIYDVPLLGLHVSAVLTNQMCTGLYRGAGRPESIYIIERLFDAAARAMALDPAELRRRNMIRPEQMPYTNVMAQVYDSGRFEQVLDQCLALADWNGFVARRAASERRGRLRGRGIATFLEWTAMVVP
ncbi:MAG TPA: molybdopterin cofactor-binding domain-containing protein [Ramlibacter sp.]|nr:molybdopterin cofactor-binding domain-containing protein [Ramlibacter sp.]